MPNNVWAYLQLSGTPSGATAGYYNQPVKMETYSGMSSSFVVDTSILYDYNYECGFIGNLKIIQYLILVVSENPISMGYASVSTEKS